ncbi:MAG: hypothetical protein FRX48_07004 [Lasallia pustulata]|uniref:t-SNARE coiled-coil homology domain-containing protein n=1 Tax=Lasallia pustulata TaxID=136370 RepID=A0A5M8PJ48_9LECA|nr:MAG: hypothetical protein FRX48_07004 [Lasallia pustulata]
MANPSQLYLLADHIKLSLLERQRAISLNLEPNSQDGHISRSLESLREGIEAVEKEQTRLEDDGDPASSNLQDQAINIRRQYDDLTSQFRGFPTQSFSSISQPNDHALTADFAHAKDRRPRNPSSSSFLKRPGAASPNPSKSVRFTDNPQTPALAEEDANRAALFPYRDDPEAPPDQSTLDNQQIHEYHNNVLRQQDEQLDRLGESIGRQRDLSIQIGDELDEHVQMLDDVDEHVDRHQSRLDKARKNLGYVARKANDNKQLTTIIILIIVLVLLIIILK